ncbi:PigN domain-containing protein [Mycena indigotica]|uniref:GPI ethanolamine phosphate transferase 1 n=1 Tax=Mycena indigotica TaxID=2126181 RepID=A0A8H6SZD7_9AGAR|nr:PigN domain-containing protein [Mycena indigotica]KAF7307451.1 PigN domain-containing protein [Mycena indigotica]
MSSSNYNTARLLLIGLVFHLVYIGSVFDCYFTSPVVHGMQSYRVESGESKRLVLIVGDGLRADLLFQKNGFSSSFRTENSPEVVAPYLRSIIEKRGAFGVSHTRVPTESRPGHVAIIAGMYEDVSAVTKGWKTNPVDFDSVFNQSSTTFSFGSPDILPMFARGAMAGKVLTWMYDEEAEDFTKDATALDIWVYDQLESLFHNATTNSTLNTQLRSPGTVFFLHLLGLDTTGHSYRPHSEEYMKNIQVVDNVVHRTEDLLRQFYKDEETSFIFTADHGMSVLGNHGDGHPDNTRTPLIAWGRGIRGPLPDSIPSSHDFYSEPWELNHLLRRDIEQADLAPLMSTLIGTSWPVNSVGVLPDVDPSQPGYILPQRGLQTLAEAAYVNAQMILEQYRINHEIRKARTVAFKPFGLLEQSTSDRTTRLSQINNAISRSDWSFARELASQLIHDGLEGLRYLQTYERRLIQGMATVAYTGWTVYASLFIFRPLDTSLPQARPRSTILDALAIISLGGFWTLFAIQRSPWTYYLYSAFPCYFWHQFATQISPVVPRWRQRLVPKQLLYIALVVAVLQSMVLAYTHRSIWSVGFILIGLVWPMLFWKQQKWSKLSFTWAASCLATAIFPLLSVNKTESSLAILSGGAVMILLGAAFFRSRITGTEHRYLYVSQTALILLAMIVTSSSVRHLQEKRGLPLVNQVAGWLILVIASLVPFLSRAKHNSVNSKLLMYFLGFGPAFVLLSISVEGLFYAAYATTLVCWIDAERAQRASQLDSIKKSRNFQQYRFQPDDVRIALFFLFFVQVGFFGTGNVASISSFYLSPVYRLIPVFNPFAMASLLIFKIIVPYIILAVTFATLNDALRLPPFSLFLVALTLTPGMTLTFFFNVTDTGEPSTFVAASSHTRGRVVAGDWAVHNVLLRCVYVTALVGWDMYRWRVSNGGCIIERLEDSSGMKRLQGIALERLGKVTRLDNVSRLRVRSCLRERSMVALRYKARSYTLALSTNPMQLTSLLRNIWRHLSFSKSRALLQIPGIWDDGHLRQTYSETLDEWRGRLLTLPRREPLDNGVVVTKVEHLEKSKGKHEFLRLHLLHKVSKEEQALIIERNIFVESTQGTSTHDTVRRGERDLRSYTSSQNIETLTFLQGECPSVIQVAFVLGALSQYSTPETDMSGKLQSQWFATAACQCLHEELKGKLGGAKVVEMRQTISTRPMLMEYKQQLSQYSAAFERVQATT